MKWYWQVYFWLFGIAVALSLLIASKWTAYDVAWFLSMLVVVPPAFAYARGKSLPHASVWSTVVLLSIAYYLVFTFYLDPNYGAYPSKTFADFFVTIAIPFPLFVAAARHRKPS